MRARYRDGMASYILKSEPAVYSYADLAADKRTHWDGVRNATAQQNMRAMKKGDTAWIYHSQTDKAIVGIAKVVKGPYPDPDQPGTTAKGDPKGVLVDIAPVAELEEPITLKALKADGRFDELGLIRQSRLSVMPVPAALDKLLREMAGVG